MTYSRIAGLVPAVAVACLFAASTHATDIAAAGPQVSAAQLIAAHGATTAPTLHIVYNTSSNSEVGKLTVDIAPDFAVIKRTAAKEGASNEVLYDFRLKRAISIDEVHHTFSNDSTYMMVDFRYIESYNRKMLRRVLTSAGISKQLPQAQNPFWDQQSLGFVAINDDQPKVDRKPTSHGGMEYVVDGKIAARFEPSAESLSSDEEKGFARFLWNTGDLHPMVVEAISATGKIPSEIESLNLMGDKQTSSIWKLDSVQRTAGQYPLTADYQSDLPHRNLSEPLRSLLPTMLQAVSGHYGTGPRSAESYQAALADALAKGETFPHFILDNEFALQYGKGTTACLSHRTEATDCANMQDVIQKYRADSRTMAMINAFDLERKGNIKEAIAQRKAVSRDGVSDPYMIDQWIGNALTESNDVDGALALLPNAIKGNPYVGAFYKDLGDAFDESFQPVEAWLCYDMARALPAGDKAPVVDGLAKKEQFLETKYPQYF